MDSIDLLWQRIEAAMRAHAPDALQRLAPGADDQAIKQLEAVIQLALPQEFRDSYRVHEGGYTVGLVTSMEAMPLAQCAAIWTMLADLLHDGEWATQSPYYFTEEVARAGWQAGPVKPAWWQRSWIPLATDAAGNLSCLDMDPAPGGTPGQIIDWDHECGPSRVLFTGFEQLLATFADQVEQGGANPTS